MSTTLTATWTDAALPHPSTVALRAVGLLSVGDEPHGAPRDLSRAHAVWGVVLDEHGHVVVKTGSFTSTYDGAEPPPSLGAEFFVHRLARWIPAVDAAIPPAIVLDEAHGVLVLSDIGKGSPASLALLAEASVADPGLLRMLGARLGAIHRDTAGLPLPPASTPLVLTVLNTREVPGLSEAAQAVAALLHADVRFVAAGRTLRHPAGRCLVHHDLKWDNIAVGPDAAPVVLDWELAGSGDPAWDLGCLVAEHLMRRDQGDPLLSASAIALLEGYRDAARISTRARAVFAERVADAAALRVAQFALELAERDSDDDPSAAFATAERAIGLLGPALTEGVRACLEG